MNENKKKNDGLLIIGLLALIVLLFSGIKFVFAGLDAAVPGLKDMAADYEERHSTSISTPVDSGEGENENPAPNFCPHCGDGLPESFAWGQFCPYCGKKVE